MQQHSLKISAAQQPTVLERVLQVSRYRGFEVNSMTMLPNSDGKSYDIELSVASEQPINFLKLQLGKLFDINEIEIQDSAMAQCRA